MLLSNPDEDIDVTKSVRDTAASPQPLDDKVVLTLDAEDAYVFFDALLDSLRVCGSEKDSCRPSTIEMCAYLAQLLYDAMGDCHA